jgi:hypothetical protein
MVIDLLSMGSARKALSKFGGATSSCSGSYTKGHFFRVSRKPRLSANDKDDDEIIPGAVHRYSGIYLRAEEDRENLS